MDITLDTARGFADAVAARPDFDLLLEPELSIVLFRPHDWAPERYRRWSAQRAHEGVALIVPTSWRGEICWRICIVNPHTTIDALLALLDDMATFE